MLSKIVKLNDGFYLDLDAIYLLAGDEARLKYEPTPLKLAWDDVNKIRKIFDKEIEARKAEERVSPFRLDPIEFVPCKHCGKKIPVTEKQLNGDTVSFQCWPCHEKEIEKKEELKNQEIKCGLCGHEALSFHIIGATLICQICEDKYKGNLNTIKVIPL